MPDLVPIVAVLALIAAVTSGEAEAARCRKRHRQLEREYELARRDKQITVEDRARYRSRL